MNTMIATPVYDDSEVVELNAANRLYLKPKTKLIISVILPEETDQCRSVSNWDILEQLKNMVAPDCFSSLRVSKTTREFVRIEGETDTKCLSHIFWEKLNGQSLQISCITKPLSIEVTEAPPEFPANDNAQDLLSQMVEDSEVIPAHNIFSSCIHLEGLPCKWFSTLGSNIEKPSEEVVRNTFEKYGKIANIDIPMLDPYREETAGSALTGGVLQPFHAFLQYESQSSTLDAINSLQGMKLIFTAEDGKSLACDIKITVDTSNHFSEEAVNKRTAERLKLLELEQQRKQEKEEEAERKRKALERKARARKRRARLKRKLQRQKQSQETVVQEQEACPEEAVEDTQEWEDRKLLLAQRRLESINLLTTILDKVNDLVQVNRLEEEQMTCEFAAEFSDYSVSTYSDNSNVMFLPITEEEESSQHENEENTDNKLEIKISEEDPQELRHERRRDSISDRSHQNNYDDDSCLGYSDEIQVPKMHYHDQHRIFKMSYKQEVSDERCSKKQKIYETDEFINYLLNHYRNPEYARLFLETNESSNRPWCQRVVVWKGNSFQIKLQTLNGHFAEMNFIPELEEETEDDCGKLEPRIAESEENSQESSLCRIKASEPQKHYVDSENEVPMTRPRPRLVKKYERVYKKTWDDEEDIESSESNDELKEVLEEISSTSEYFSEELSGISGKQPNISRTSRKQRNAKQLKKIKHCNVSGNNQVCHHEDLLGHLLHSYCQNLKKHSRCKLTQNCRGQPNLHNQYDSDTYESNTDMEAEVQKTWKRKRSKIKNPACYLEEKKLKKETYSSSEDDSSSSDSHLHKRNIWRKQYNGMPKRKIQKTRSCDSDEKPKRQWDLYFAEDVSDSPEQEESSCDDEETQSSCSPISSHPAGENEPLGGCSKGVYTDYWDWE
ncbi:A-kinase anchor protein 17B-like [Pseudophryne corroboree]|uniref:A-kinase anchor protein 17B-like n=1 Tax=Pseudophryne corroboree TaxID=495146 RepID=UPI003081BBB8